MALDLEPGTMYLPAHFEEGRIEILHQLIDEFPLATLVTLGPSGLVGDHIPLLFDDRGGPQGRLIGHVARRNELWHQHDGEADVLAVFQGASAYISPNWYATKQETHQVVPTYNYAVVHAYGPLVVHEDAKWLRGVVGKLTKTMEMSEPIPWKMGDAPGDFITEQLTNIVGIEIPITRLIGKWKVSQNRPQADQVGAMAGLRSRNYQDDRAMADLIAAKATSGQT